MPLLAYPNATKQQRWTLNNQAWEGRSIRKILLREMQSGNLWTHKKVPTWCANTQHWEDPDHPLSQYHRISHSQKPWLKQSHRPRWHFSACPENLCLSTSTTTVQTFLTVFPVWHPAIFLEGCKCSAHLQKSPARLSATTDLSPCWRSCQRWWRQL